MGFCTNFATSAFASTWRLHFKNHNFHDDFGANWSSTNFQNCFYRNGRQITEVDRGPLPNVTNWDMSLATNVVNFFRETKYTDGQTFAPSSSWDLSNISGTGLAIFCTTQVLVLKLGIGVMLQ